MNRDIKFRVWDTLRKEFNEDDHFQNEFISIALGFHSDVCVSKDDLVLQQYTGLKDKNGKEIYEGDILKIYWRIEHLDMDFYLDEVKWNNEQLCWRPNGTLTIDSIENEVVGNVFENPELL